MTDRGDISIEQLHRDVMSHAGTLTALVEDQRNMRTVLDEMKTDRAVRVERDRNLNDHLERIEGRIAGIHNLGKWVLGAFGGALMIAIVTFVKNGGLNVPLP